MAVTIRSFLVPMTSSKFSTSLHSVGKLKSRLDASRRSFAAVRTMKMNGTTKTTNVTASAMTSSAVGAEPTRDAHSSTSWRLKNRIIGNTIKVIAMNMITLPAVASP